jgi:hypothetical protein
MDAKPIPLAAGIRSLREELIKAIDARPDEGVQFTVDSINLEMQVAFQSENTQELSVGWSLLGWQFGGKGAAKDSNSGVHTIKITLKPEIVKDGRVNPLVAISADTDEDH